MATTAKKRTKIPVKPRLPRRKLPINVGNPQEHRNWCWAACSEAVLGFRRRPESQSHLADSVPRLGGGCSTAPLPVPCDQMLTSAEITTLLTARLPTPQQTRKISERTLSDELAAGRPVMVGFSWGHVYLVYGTVGPSFMVYDPAGAAKGDLSYAQLATYHDDDDDNVWSHSWTGL
jgi:Papain-like cysteine protease AvrRpt2